MVGKCALICAIEIQKFHMVVHIFSGFALVTPSQFNASFPIARPTHFFGKVKKKNSRITCKEASTLIYKHTILSY